MGTPGPLEIIIIFLVILLIFGAKRIPEIARGLGKGIREFKQATSEISKELTVEDKPSIQPPRQSTPVSYAPPPQQAQQTPAPPPQQASAPPPDNAGGPPAQ
jgi:sec-independent protein translocase protein TatA